MGFLSRRFRGLRPCVESVPEPEYASPVLTWMLGNFWSLPGDSVLVSSGGMHVAFLPSCRSSVMLPFAWIRGSVVCLEAFPRGFSRGSPTGLSHVPPWCESILGFKVEAVQGKQVSLEWIEISGELWEWWHDLEFLWPFLWRPPPLEMRQERREFFPEHAGKGSLLSS